MVSDGDRSIRDENQDSRTGNFMDSSAISLRLDILDEAHVLGERG